MQNLGGTSILKRKYQSDYEKMNPGKQSSEDMMHFITSLFCIQASPKVAINRGGCGIHKNGCAQHGSPPAEKNEMSWAQ